MSILHYHPIVLRSKQKLCEQHCIILTHLALQWVILVLLLRRITEIFLRELQRHSLAFLHLI